MADAVADTTGNNERERTNRGWANIKPWPKGVSGNPNGRPKKAQQIVKTAEELSDEALKVVAALMFSKDPAVALRAAQTILDRAVGKPKQAVDINTDRKNAADYDRDELFAIAGLGSTGDHPQGKGSSESH